jgi:hypothetical protein
VHRLASESTKIAFIIGSGYVYNLCRSASLNFPREYYEIMNLDRNLDPEISDYTHFIKFTCANLD